MPKICSQYPSTGASWFSVGFVHVGGWVLQIMNRIRELTTVESNAVSGNA